MKIATQYVKMFKKLRNRLQREVPISKTHKKDILSEDPIEILIYGILMETNTLFKSRIAFNIINESMINYNELRVTPVLELTQLFQKKAIKEPEQTAESVTKTLNLMMEKFDTLNLSMLHERTKSDLRKEFEKVENASSYAILFMLLKCFGVPVMPLSDNMLRLLKKEQALPEEIDITGAQAFIERQLKATEIENFYWQLQKTVESLPKSSAAKKKTAKKKTVKKAAKKKKTTKKRSK